MNRVERLMLDLPDDGLPDVAFSFSRKAAALVVVDPQRAFLEPTGPAVLALNESLTENDTVANLARLMHSAVVADLPVFISPHARSKHYREWRCGGTMELYMQLTGLLGGSDRLKDYPIKTSDHDWPMALRGIIELQSTVVCTPHFGFSPESNDLRHRLHTRRIRQVLLAGMTANLCVEGHLRSLMESGFEVAVVADATAAVKTAGLDGFLAAFTNFRMLASAVWCSSFATEEILR